MGQKQHGKAADCLRRAAKIKPENRLYPPRPGIASSALEILKRKKFLPSFVDRA